MCKLTFVCGENVHLYACVCIYNTFGVCKPESIYKSATKCAYLYVFNVCTYIYIYIYIYVFMSGEVYVSVYVTYRHMCLVHVVIRSKCKFYLFCSSRQNVFDVFESFILNLESKTIFFLP